MSLCVVWYGEKGWKFFGEAQAFSLLAHQKFISPIWKENKSENSCCSTMTKLPQNFNALQESHLSPPTSPGLGSTHLLYVLFVCISSSLSSTQLNNNSSHLFPFFPLVFTTLFVFQILFFFFGCPLVCVCVCVCVYIRL